MTSKITESVKMMAKINETIVYLSQRLGEPSTWRGIVLAITALGYTLSDDQQNAIIAAGLAVAGAIGALTKDKK